MIKKPPRKQKYNAKRAQWQNRMYDSRAERDYRSYLDILEKAKLVSQIEEQPKVLLTDAGISYKPDFKFRDNKLGKTIWVDVKGVETKEFLLKSKLWKFYGPGELHVIKRQSGRSPWKTTKVIKPELIVEGTK